MKKEEDNRGLEYLLEGEEEDLWEETAVMPVDELDKIKEEMIAKMGVVDMETEEVTKLQPNPLMSGKIGIHDRTTAPPSDPVSYADSVGHKEEIPLRPLNSQLQEIPQRTTRPPKPVAPVLQKSVPPKPVSPFLQLVRTHQVALAIGIGVGVLAGVAIIIAVYYPSFIEKKDYVAAALEEAKQAPVVEKEVESENKNQAESETSEVEKKIAEPNEPEAELEDLGTIKENYQLARKYYLEGDRGRSSGKKLSKGERINSLLKALPYFENLIKLHKRENTDDPDVWFLKARTEYSLAKFGHERQESAKLAIESYKRFKSSGKRPSRNQKKTMVRNMKALRSWGK